MRTSKQRNWNRSGAKVHGTREWAMFVSVFVASLSGQTFRMRRLQARKSMQHNRRMPEID